MIGDSGFNGESYVITKERGAKSLCLIHCSIAERKHRDQDNSYQRKDLIICYLTISEVGPLSPWQGA